MRILFVAPRAMGTGIATRRLTTFHEADVLLLRRLGHEVDVMPWEGRPWFSLLKRATQADVLFVWTVGDHTALAIAAARLLRKPVLVVIGGYEFANLPRLRYGNLANPRGQILSRIVWNSSAHLLFVDPSLEREAQDAFGMRPREPREWPLQNDATTYRCHYIPTGHDASYWKPDGAKKDSVVMVAHAPSWGRVVLKGVDRFLRLALLFPQMQFHLLGQLPPQVSTLPGALCPNVHLHGWVERERARQILRQASVYCQLSLHEGLPNSLCEAMLCGAIPIGSDLSGIRAAIGNRGLIVEDGEEADVLAFALGLAGYARMRERARNRIRTLFPIERRQRELGRILETL